MLLTRVRNSKKIFVRLFLTLAAVITLFLVAAPSAHAQATITVNSNAEEFPSVNNGNCTLREAIKAANTNAPVDGCAAGQSGGTDTIVLQFAAGPYLFDNVDNTAVGSSALPVITSSILIDAQNQELKRNLFFGHTPPNFRLFIVQGGSLTLTRTFSEFGNIADGDGGFAYVENGTLTITQCDMSRHFATLGHFGGMVALVNSTLNVTDSSFGGQSDGGGGVINGSASTIVITNSQIGGGTFGDGGVIRCFTNCSTTIVDSYLLGGAGNGGAIATDSIVSLTGVWIDRSSAGFGFPAAGGRGGAIDSSGTLTIQDSLFTQNLTQGDDTTLGEGGAIYSTGTLTISGTTFHNNAAVGTSLGPGARGGAILFGGSGTITNSTINGNTASLPGSGGQGGGGIFVRNTATLVLNNVTITLNSGGSGIVREAGGAGTVTLRNSIIARNVGDGVPLSQPPSDCIGTFVSQGHNLFSFNTGCTFTPASGDQVGTAANPVDPVIGVMDNSAGKTVGCNIASFCSQDQIPTRRLLITSPAIDAGDPALPGSGGTACAGTDQNGVTRPVGAACDIGAWEGVAIVPVVDIALTKTDLPDPVAVGGTLTYTINLDMTLSVENAPAVVVTDTLPPGVTFVSATPNTPDWGAAFSNCTELAGVVTCTFTSLLRGFLNNAGSVVIVVQPTASAVSPLINSASVTSLGTEADNSNNSATASTVISGAGGGTTADLSLTKSGPTSFALGSGNITYTLVVSNAGPADATNVVMTDTLPAGVTFVSVTPTGPVCTEAAGIVTCNLGGMVNGGSATITIIVTPTAAGTLNNTASVTATETDPVPGNNTATAGTTVNPSADLAVTKSGSSGSVNVNANLTYTITVTNNGPSAAASASLSDALPAGVNFVSLAPPAGWTCTTPAVGANGTVTCTNPSLASGASATFTLVVTPSAGAAASINNTATVNSTTSDPNAANNSQTATTTVNPIADLAITKTDTPDPAAVSSNITYTITVTNNGPSSATGVSFTDNVPANVTFVSATGSGTVTCSQAAGVITCTVGTLASGATATATVVVRTTALGTVTNTASVTSSTSDPSAANNSATATTTVNVAPATDFSLTLVPIIREVRAGGTATYTATLTPLPAGSSFNTAIGLTCFTTLLGANCTAAPGSATPGLNPATSTISVAIPKGSLVPFTPRSPRPPVFQPWLLWLLGTLLAAYSVLALRHKRRWRMRAVSLAGMLLALALALGQSACSTASEPPIAPYILTVTATSGSLSHSATATVNVVK